MGYTFQNMEKKEQIIQYIGGLSIGFCTGVCVHELIHNQEQWRNTLDSGIKNLKLKIPTNLKKSPNGNEQINKENEKSESKRPSRHTNEIKNNKTDDHRNQLENFETRATQEKRKTKKNQTGVKVNTDKKGKKMQENSTADITQELWKTQGSKNIPPGSDIQDQAYDNKGYEKEIKSNEEDLKLTVKANQNPASSKNTIKNQNKTSNSSSTSDDSDEKDDVDMSQTKKAALSKRTSRHTNETKKNKTGVKVNTEKKGNKMQENSTADITQELSK